MGRIEAAMIFLDDRQGSGELYSSFSLPTCLCRLEYADFMFFGNGPDGGISVGIERKKIHDLIDSMESGRLSAHQLLGLTDSYDVVYLLVEGSWRPGPTGILEVLNSRRQWCQIEHGRRRFMYRDIAAFLNSVTITARSHVWRTESDTESVLWIESVFKSWNKPWAEHTLFKKFQDIPLARANMVEPSVTRKMFKELTGIGWEKSVVLEKAFPSMESLVEADPKSIRQVPGIGKKIAERIYKEVRGQ